MDQKRPSSRQIGAIGEKLVAGWCAAKDMNVSRAPEREADRIIDGQRVEIKFSTLWGNGTYTFQQLRDQNYDYVICLGLSPFVAHGWVLAKQYILEQWNAPEGGVYSLHAGQRGVDTAWFTVNPDSPPTWLDGCGGSLANAFTVIQQWRQPT